MSAYVCVCVRLHSWWAEAASARVRVCMCLRACALGGRRRRQAIKSADANASATHAPPHLRSRPALATDGNDAIGLGVGKEALECHYPRVPRVHDRLQVRVLR